MKSPKFYKLFIIFLLPTLLIYGQNEGERFADRLMYGGDFYLQFGTIRQVILSPRVAYKFTEKYSAGVGISFMYYDNKNYNNETFVYGGSLFMDYTLFNFVFAHCETESLNMETYDLAPFSTTKWIATREWVTGVYVGGGISIPMGERAKTVLMVLYNLNQTRDTPFSNPQIRIGVQF